MRPVLATGATRIHWMDPLAESDWDARIAALPGASFFHGSHWARVLQATYGFTPRYLAASCGPRLVGLLPLIEVDSWLTGRRGVGLPFSDACAPLAESDLVLKQLWAAALEEGAARRWKYCEVRGARERLGGPASRSYLGHTLELTRDTESLWRATSDSVRRSVRKAERMDMDVSFRTDLTAVDTFYRLLEVTRRRHGVPPQPRRFFDLIQQHVLEPGHGFVALAGPSDRPVAGAVFFRFASSVLFKFGASNDEGLELGANHLLFWRTILTLAGSGVKTLDFGRTDLGHSGLRRFKSSWGAHERPLDYIRYDFSRHALVAAPASPAGLSTSLFRLLPAAVSRGLGSCLYKHVA